MLLGHVYDEDKRWFRDTVRWFSQKANEIVFIGLKTGQRAREQPKNKK